VLQWVAAVTGLLSAVAWPLVAAFALLMFRKELRRRLNSIREVKYPGGSITLGEVERLEATIQHAEVVEDFGTLRARTRELPSVSLADSQLAIAHSRLEAERELFRLSQTKLPSREITSWPVGRHVDELERAGVLSKPLAANIRTFIELSNRILHSANIDAEVSFRASAIGSTLAAELRRRRVVTELIQDFMGHGLWHMHRHLEDEIARKHYFWSAVAASLPDFDHDYDIYLEAAEHHNDHVRADAADGQPFERIYVLSLDEFVSVLEFREKELLRLIDSWGQPGQNFEKANEWRWPKEWGQLGWNCPVIRERASLHAAQQELAATRAALDKHRSRLLGASQR